jgi:hypothetical protein
MVRGSWLWVRCSSTTTRRVGSRWSVVRLMPTADATVVKVTGSPSRERSAQACSTWPGSRGLSSRQILTFGPECVEAADETPVAFGLVDPTACLGVGRQRFGVDPLSRENRDAGDVGAEVGAVVANVSSSPLRVGSPAKSEASRKPPIATSRGRPRSVATCSTRRVLPSPGAPQRRTD